MSRSSVFCDQYLQGFILPHLLAPLACPETGGTGSTVSALVCSRAVKTEGIDQAVDADETVSACRAVKTVSTSEK